VTREPSRPAISISRVLSRVIVTFAVLEGDRIVVRKTLSRSRRERIPTI
jgi:hypothetical protein